MSKSSRSVVSILAILLWLPLGALAQKKQSSKIPVINSISPSSAYAGGTTFALTVNGSNFTSGSVVQWNGGARTTTVFGSTQLQAQISSADVASAGTAKVTVNNPGRLGGTSFSAMSFTINPVPTPPPTSTTSTTTSTTPSTPPTTTTTTALAITTTSVPGGTAGASYPTTALAASGGSPAYTWSVPTGGGTLPPGIALTASGAVSGVPTNAGTYSFTAQATDTAGQVAQKGFSLTVAPSTTGYLLQDDFESGNFSQWAPTQLWPSMNPAITSSVKHNGTYAYEQHFYLCGDSTNTACGGPSQDFNRFIYKDFNSTNGFPNGIDDIFIRGYVYHKYPETGGTVDNVQRKLIYFRDGSYWWGFLATDSSNGALPLRLSTNSDSATVGVPPVTYWNLATLTYNQWYCVEVEIKANTPGLSDGRLTVWVDGTQVFQKTGVNLRGSLTTGLQTASFGEQANRYNYNPVDEYRYWDDTVMSTSYIGP